MHEPVSFAEDLRTQVETASATDGTPAERLLRAADAFLRHALANPAAFRDLSDERSERAIPGREVLEGLYREHGRAHRWTLAQADERFEWLWAAVYATADAYVDEALAGGPFPSGVVRRLLHRQLSALLSATEPPPPPEIAVPPAPEPEEGAGAGSASPGDPSIYDFVHYREYVREWLRVRAGHPSLRGLAKRMGRAPSFLSSVLSGDRDLNAFDAQALAEQLGLDKNGLRYFQDLIEYDQAGPHSIRHAALDRITANRRFHQASRIVDQAWALFRAWYAPALLELVRCEGFKEDPEWIARALRPAITPAEAREALELLLEVKLLKRGEDGRLHVAAPLVLTGHEVTRARSVGLAAWHQWLAERAAHVLDTLPPQERHFAAASFAASPELFQEMKERVTRFMEEAVGQGASEGAPPTRVYQLAFQMFPVSRELGEEPPTGS